MDTKSHLTKTSGSIDKEKREALLKQKAITYWITGLSGSGKSTIAYALEKELIARGKICYVLDGDNIRHGLNNDLGFSADDRAENIRRIAEVSRLMNEAGLIVISAFISPFHSDRTIAREIIGKENYIEVYLSTPMEVCEARDPKGLYKKARLGEIFEFTGISSPYEIPLEPCQTIDTSEYSIDETVSTILKASQIIKTCNLCSEESKS